MTVEVRVPKISYSGNGTADPLAVPFRFLDADDLVVTRIAVDLSETVLTRGSHYNVTGAGAPEGGRVTPVAPVATGLIWRIERSTPLEQPTRFSDGYYSAAAQELALDRQMLALQEVDRDLIALEGSAIKGQPGEGVTLPPRSAMTGGNLVLGPNATTGVIEVLDGSDFAGDQGPQGLNASEMWQTVTFARDSIEFPLATGQTAFDIPFDFLPGISFVSMNAAPLVEGKDYDATGAQLVLADPVIAENDNLVVTLLPLPAIADVRMLNIAQIADFRRRLRTGQAATAVLQGDSILYSQDTISGVNSPPINGATQTRSIQTIEANAIEALQLAGATIAIAVQAYPGDSSLVGRDRWAGAGRGHARLIMYGHNDANGYGGWPLVSPAQFTAVMDGMILRAILGGEGVFVGIPPHVYDQAQDFAIAPYRDAARRLAEKYGCETIDFGEVAQALLSPTVDGVHSQSFLNAEFGWHGVAATFLGAAQRRVADGDVFYCDDGLVLGGSIFVDARSRTGRFLQIDPGKSVIVTASFMDNVRPVLRLFQDTSDTVLAMYYSGGASSYRGLASAQHQHDKDYPASTFIGTVIRRGVHYVAFRNDGAAPIFCESIGFESRPAMMSRGLAQRAPAMAIEQPRYWSRQLDTWWCHRDASMRLAGPFDATWMLDLDDAGLNGAAIWNGPSGNWGDFPALNAVLLVRAGADLHLYELVSLAATAPTVAAGVFGAGRWQGQLHLRMRNGNAQVFVDGASSPVITRNATPLMIGNPGLIADSDSFMACRGFLSNGIIKEPY